MAPATARTPRLTRTARTPSRDRTIERSTRPCEWPCEWPCERPCEWPREWPRGCAWSWRGSSVPALLTVATGPGALGASSRCASVPRLGRRTARPRVDVARGVAQARAVTAETRYARSGDVHIAYQVIGHGSVDLVF